MTSTLVTRSLGLRIGERILVHALDWKVESGQCWCVIGRNGAGKSTLMRTLAGLRPPDSGTVELDGRTIDAWPLQELAHRRAFLPQGRVDAFGYRVLDTVLSARHPYSGGAYWESQDDMKAAHDALRQLDVEDLAQRDIRSLSGGERQRVAIAAVMAQDTPLLLLDEPANALDLAHQVATMNLLARLCRDAGKAVIMVSHDLNLADHAASHALLLMEGGEWQAGPVNETMSGALLGRCLGHPVETIRHGGRTIFLPARGQQNA